MATLKRQYNLALFLNHFSLRLVFCENYEACFYQKRIKMKLY